MIISEFTSGKEFNMNETYVECLVAKGVSTVAQILRILLVLCTAGFAVLGLMGYLFPVLLALIFGFVTWFVYMHTDTEYEYLYLDHEIKVDKILNKSKRKRVAVFDVERMEIFAPLNSYHLDAYKNRKVDVSDYSSGKAKQPEARYVFYYDGAQKVILEPSDAFIKAVQNIAPRKVFTD